MRLIVAAVGLLVATIFALQNTAIVNVSVFFWHLRASLAIVIASCLVLGLFLGFASILPLLWRSRRNERWLEAQLATTKTAKDNTPIRPGVDSTPPRHGSAADFTSSP